MQLLHPPLAWLFTRSSCRGGGVFASAPFQYPPSCAVEKQAGGYDADSRGEAEADDEVCVPSFGRAASMGCLMVGVRVVLVLEGCFGHVVDEC